MNRLVSPCAFLVILAHILKPSNGASVCCAATNNEVRNRCMDGMNVRPPDMCDIVTRDWDPSIMHVNIMSTQVLLAWRPLESIPNATYTVILNSTGTQDIEVTTTQEWILLNGLEQPAYDVRICTSDCCCVESFATGQVLVSIVTGIRVPLFNPLLDGGASLSAQVVWNQPLNNGVERYLVEARHVDNHLEALPMSPYSVSPPDTYTTIVSLGTRNEYVYPLQFNSTYLVRVGVVVAMGTMMWSNPILFYTNGTDTLHEVFVVSSVNQINNGRLIGGQAGDEHMNMFGPLAVDVARRAILYFDEDMCIQRCPYDSSQLCQRLNGSCLPGNSVIVKAMAYDWIAEDIYIAAIDTNFTLLKFSEKNTQAQGYHVIYTGGPASFTNIRLTMNPYNGVVHWTVQVEDTAVLNRLDLKASPLSHQPRSISGITSAIYSTVRYNCLLVVKTDGTLVSLDETTVDTTQQNCGSGAFSINGVVPNSSVVGFDDQGLYYIQQNPDLNVGFIPFWGFEGLNATIMTNIDGSAKSITGTSPGQQPLPANPNCLSLDYAKFSNRPIPVLNKTSETSLFISWQDNATPVANCTSTLPELFSTPLTQYNVYVSNNTGPLEGYNPLVQYRNTVELTNLDPSSSYSISIEARNKYTLLNESGINDLRGPVVTYEANRASITSVSLPTPSAMVSPTFTGSDETTDIALLAGIGGGAAAILLLAVVIIAIVILVACIVVKRNERKSYPMTGDGNNGPLNSPMYKSPVYQEPAELLPPRGGLHLERSQTIDSSHSVSIMVDKSLLNSSGVEYAEIGQPIQRCFTDPSAMMNKQFEGNSGSTEELLSMTLQPRSLQRPQPYQVHVPSRSATPHNGLAMTTFSILQEASGSIGSQLSLPQPYEVPSRVSSPANLSDTHSNAPLVPTNLSDPQSSGTPPTPPRRNGSQDSAAENTNFFLPNSQESAEDHIYSQLQHNKSSEALSRKEKEASLNNYTDNPAPLYSSLSCEMTEKQQQS